MMLITVEDIFDLGNRLVLAPGVDSSVADTLRGITTVKLIFPNGSSCKVDLVGIELITPKIYPIAISKSLDKNAIPIGTQVWTIDNFIEYTLPENVQIVRIDIWNQFGSFVRQLVDESNPSAGQKSVVWDGQNDLGESLSPGIFIYRLTVDGNAESRVIRLNT